MKLTAWIAAWLSGPLSPGVSTVTSSAATAAKTASGPPSSRARCFARRRDQRSRGDRACRADHMRRGADSGTGDAVIWRARSLNTAGDARRAAWASVTGATWVMSMMSGMNVVPPVRNVGEFGGEPRAGAVQPDADSVTGAAEDHRQLAVIQALPRVQRQQFALFLGEPGQR